MYKNRYAALKQDSEARIAALEAEMKMQQWELDFNDAPSATGAVPSTPPPSSSSSYSDNTPVKRSKAAAKQGYMSPSQTDSWSTPPLLRAELAKEFGPFSTFDPCPLGGAKDSTVADGLAIPWPVHSTSDSTSNMLQASASDD